MLCQTKYKEQAHATKYTGTKPILVVCTDEGLMPMKNGRTFSTGNHPVEVREQPGPYPHPHPNPNEGTRAARTLNLTLTLTLKMLVPMLHFRDAGFTFDIATASGQPVVLEMWAYPGKDASVKELHDSVRAMMERPKKLEDIQSLDDYSALFIPGGHGCMINLPTNVQLGKLLNIAHARALPTVTLCHGPSALLASCLEGTGQVECAYKGYKTMCFTDKTDAFTPSIGYLPGPMPWKVQQALEAKGVEVLNKKETGAVTVDRELITGDSPDAAHNLGVLAAPLLVKFWM